MQRTRHGVPATTKRTAGKPRHKCKWEYNADRTRRTCRCGASDQNSRGFA